MAAVEMSGAHERLESIGLPPNLLPHNVVTYSYNEEDGSFELHLTQEVVTERAGEDVKFEKVMRGKMKELQLYNLTGVKTKQLFWLTVSSITRPARDSPKMYFKVGILNAGLPVAAFKDPILVNTS